MPEVDSTELERYLRIYQQNPDSRVFAPLADMYRRMARYKEAEEICREGLLRHPYYAGGKVALAFILLETQRLDEALAEVDQVVTYYPDNLMARKILIRVLCGQGELDRAQREYQALLQMAPQLSGDPDLERALSSGSEGGQLPRSDSSGPREGLARGVRVHSSQEPTEHEGARKTMLLRRKEVIERWLQLLEGRAL